jgi:hypothetical protein
MGSPFDGESFTGLCVGIDRFARWDVYCEHYIHIWRFKWQKSEKPILSEPASMFASLTAFTL